jgi:hypothetical protein
MIRKISDINAARILNSVWTGKSVSRIELSRRLSLDKSTVTKIVTDLIDKKLIRPSLKGESGPNGGRKPVELVIQEGCGCVLGIELRPDGYRARVLDLSGSSLMEASSDLPLPEEDLAERCVGLVSGLRARMGSSLPPVLGVGIGLPGMVDAERGLLLRSEALGIAEPYPLVDAVGERMGAPLLIDNDSCCGCMSVLAFHATAPRNFIFVIAECVRMEGAAAPNCLVAGMGIVLDGKVFRGDKGRAGEFVTLFRADGLPSGASEGEGEDRMMEAAPESRRAAFAELARNVAFLARVMDVNAVYLGGGLRRYGEEALQAMREAGLRGGEGAGEGGLSVDFSPHGEDVLAYGAAGLALEGLFRIPRKGGVRKTDFPVLLGL